MINDKQEKEFVEAYDKYSEAIFRHCYYRVFDVERAKDFVQESFCRTWKYIADGNNVENIRAFLYKTANNIIIDESRKIKNLSLNEIMEKGFFPKVDPRKTTEDYFAAKEVIEVVSSLDQEYRDVIIMKYIDGFSSKEIASIIGQTDNNVYVKIHRGLQKVKEILKKHEVRKKI